MSTESKLKVSLFDVVDEISASAKLTKANEAFSWEASVFPVINRPYWQMFLGILEKRKTIPAWQQKDEFLQALLANQTLIFVGETGRRKTNKDHWSKSPMQGMMWSNRFPICFGG